MAGLAPAQVPQEMPPGRALVLPDGHELQLAVLGESAEGPEQSRALREIAGRADQPLHHRPRRFARLPDRLPWSELIAQLGDPSAHPSDALLLGCGGPEAEPVVLHPDPVHGQAVLIAGPPGSGRSSALLTLAHQLLTRGPVLWHGASGPPSPHTGLEFVTGQDPDAVWARLTAGWATLVIDDVELLTHDDPYDQLALAHLERCGQGQGGLLVAGASSDLVAAYRGIAYELRRRQTGVLLQPSRTDGDLFGTAVAAPGRSLPGRGVLVVRGRAQEVQVAEPAELPALPPRIAASVG